MRNFSVYYISFILFILFSISIKRHNSLVPYKNKYARSKISVKEKIDQDTFRRASLKSTTVEVNEERINKEIKYRLGDVKNPDPAVFLQAIRDLCKENLHQSNKIAEKNEQLAKKDQMVAKDYEAVIRKNVRYDMMRSCVIFQYSIYFIRSALETKISAGLKSLGSIKLGKSTLSMFHVAEKAIVDFEARKNISFSTPTPPLPSPGDPPLQFTVELKLDDIFQQCIFLLSYSTSGAWAKLKGRLKNEDAQVLFCSDLAELWIVTGNRIYIPPPLIAAANPTLEEIIQHFSACYQITNPTLVREVRLIMESNYPDEDLTPKSPYRL